MSWPCPRGGMYGRNLALTRDGLVADWPVSGARYDSTVPAGLSNVVAVSAGWGHNLALRAGGTVVGWGFNSFGERGQTRMALKLRRCFSAVVLPVAIAVLRI